MPSIEDVLRLLPHRPPFLLLDAVTEFEAGVRVVALKRVTADEASDAASKVVYFAALDHVRRDDGSRRARDVGATTRASPARTAARTPRPA